MPLSVIYSRATVGVEAPAVQVETHLSGGLPALNIVGLPATAVRESRDRVRSALLNAHFQFPDGRITVNLAPADLPKEGGRFDLPIALGILAASGQLPSRHLARHECVGELSLGGELRAVPGIIPVAQACTRAGRRLLAPASTATLASVVPGSQVIAACDLLTACAHLNGREPLAPVASTPLTDTGESGPDLADVVGQVQARRALEVAASGGHHLLFSGPPGTGKTLLASRLPGILPPASAEDLLTNAALHSLSDSTSLAPLRRRPFRHPHHGASAAALVGGGGRPMPGEVSLAHGGVLFLDELPEFHRSVLDMLREPLESGQVTISRARQRITYPARFQLVAAMNPCPCGYDGDPERDCHCTPEQILRYRQRLSGPLLDRMDLRVTVGRLAPGALLEVSARGESSAQVRARVIRCRNAQLRRQGCENAALVGDALLQVCALGSAERSHLAKAAERLQLSGRGVHRCLRVARTLADMAGANCVGRAHLNEALAYRRN
ncbi:MAG: ATP-dependent protease [Haliea sp.]|jgi:magnesium chelatase family protein|nr:ATP-dependent protease [Haliea sp.]